MLPLIDIVFLLLIFFIYAMLSMAVHRGLQLDLPESSTARPEKDELLSISVKRYGAEENGLLVQVNETPVKPELLGDKLRQLVEGKKKQKVLIFAEKSISYQELFQILDQVKSAGLTEISLQADKAGE